VLITHGESGRSGVGRTRNVVAPTSQADRDAYDGKVIFLERAWAVHSIRERLLADRT
jgi:hypothetical protein